MKNWAIWTRENKVCDQRLPRFPQNKSTDFTSATHLGGKTHQLRTKDLCINLSKHVIFTCMHICIFVMTFFGQNILLRAAPFKH